MRGAGLNRILAMTALMPVAGRSPIYARLLWSLVVDERVPVSNKAILGAAVAYFALPFDLVPDRIPVFGVIDDLVVVVFGLDLFLSSLPDELIDEKLVALGLDRASFERDLGQIRRLTPRPIRRLARRIPQVADVVVGAARATRLGPRVRRFIDKEGSFA